MCEHFPNLLIGPGREKGPARPLQRPADAEHLIRCLPLGEYDFRVSLSEPPTVVHLGVGEILDGKVAQPLQCRHGGDTASGDGVQQLLQPFPPHTAAALGAR